MNGKRVRSWKVAPARRDYAEMIYRHLLQLVTHAAAAGRHAAIYSQAAGRAALVALTRVESPRQAFRTARRRIRSARNESRSKQTKRRVAPLLIHYHIFKNAGSSFEFALDQAWRRGLHRYDTPFHDGFISQADLRRYALSHPTAQAIVTHQAAPPPPRIPRRQVLTSILIRDPIARIRSIYAFERAQASEDPGPVKAKELAFKDYVEWRLKVSPGMFCNFQVHFCNRDGSRNHSPMTRHHLDIAIEALDTINIVGTVERYDQWLALAQSILGEGFDKISLVSVRENRSAADSVHSEALILEQLVRDLGQELAQELLKQNELDMCLHQVADALLTRRLAERLVRINLRDAYDQLGAEERV
jgi:hypothetical protein